MTYEKALEIKQNLTPEQVRNDLERYLLRGELPIVKGVAMAMQALEKQIPKKPIDVEFQWCVCPACGGSVCLDNVLEHLQNHETTFCEHCGQALDWGDSE